VSCNNQANCSSLKPDTPNCGTLSNGNLTDGGGIKDFTYNGLNSATIEVNATVVRTFRNQNISGDKYFHDDVIIKNLTVTGVQYIEHSKDLYIGDPLITLNSGVAGSNTYDIGFVGDRGTDINIGMIWDESADQFAFISTTENGSTLGAVNISSYQDLKIDSLYTTGSIHLENGERLKWADTNGNQNATIWVNSYDELRLTNNTNGNGGDIVFATKTGSQPSARIKSNGRVGIGTNNPIGVLHVNGDSYLQTGYINLTGTWEQFKCAATKACDYFVKSSDISLYVPKSETGCAAWQTCDYFTGNLFSYPLSTTLTDNQYLVYDATAGKWEPTDVVSSVSPGGTNTNVQFNDAGVFNGNNGLTYNKTTFTLSANGDIVAYASSDNRLKDNVENISDPILKLKQLNGVEFDWNSKAYDHLSGHDVGVLAQDVQNVIPEAVKTRDDGMLAVRYEKMIPLLIECIKDQQIQIDQLKELINTKSI
tara:strand:+ start:3867 stop:5306 length:1440 start_codon:yes stop_codon:yes gene_type:complete